jgi:HD-GYP domain-containing protein (c-di-GMP phosphodiesterase class II)
MQPRPIGDAIAELRRCAGSQFDKNIVEVFCQTVIHDHDHSHVQTRAR